MLLYLKSYYYVYIIKTNEKYHSSSINKHCKNFLLLVITNFYCKI